MFFQFEQNNVGGFFAEGLPATLFIEASSPDEANEIAEANGVNFDDACHCCGDRWLRAYSVDHALNAVAFAEAVLFSAKYDRDFRVIALP